MDISLVTKQDFDVLEAKLDKIVATQAAAPNQYIVKEIQKQLQEILGEIKGIMDGSAAGEPFLVSKAKAKFLLGGISTYKIDQLVESGVLTPKRFPESDKIYFNLDEIKEVAGVIN